MGRWEREREKERTRSYEETERRVEKELRRERESENDGYFVAYKLIMSYLDSLKCKLLLFLFDVFN